MPKRIFMAVAILVFCALAAPSQAWPMPDQAHLQWLTAKAADGQPEAQYNLGKYYLFERQIPNAGANAWFWLHSAADMNYAPAQFLMAYLCRQGIGMAKNAESEADWLKLAAQNGDQCARLALKGMPYAKIIQDYLR